MFTNLCANCNVCDDHLPMLDERILLVESEGPSQVLVLDDPLTQADYGRGRLIASRLLGGVPFDYSATVRCDTDGVGEDALAVGISRCSVWTGLICEQRKLILSTKRGLQQMRVGADKDEGDAFRVMRLGVILCIPPLHTLGRGVGELSKRVERVVREAGVR